MRIRFVAICSISAFRTLDLGLAALAASSIKALLRLLLYDIVLLSCLLERALLPDCESWSLRNWLRCWCYLGPSRDSRLILFSAYEPVRCPRDLSMRF